VHKKIDVPPHERTRVCKTAIDELPAGRAGGALAGEVEVVKQLAPPEGVVCAEICESPARTCEGEQICDREAREEVVKQNLDREVSKRASHGVWWESSGVCEI
jgi:hypothetical protein